MNGQGRSICLILIFAAVLLLCGVAGVMSNETNAGAEEGSRGWWAIDLIYAGNTMIDVQWGEYKGGDFSAYHIYRDDSFVHEETNASSIFWRDQSGISPGNEYEYEIRVIDDEDEIKEQGNNTFSNTLVHGTITIDTHWFAGDGPFNVDQVTVDNGTLSIGMDAEVIIQDFIAVRGGSGGSLSSIDTVNLSGNKLAVWDTGSLSLSDSTVELFELEAHRISGGVSVIDCQVTNTTFDILESPGSMFTDGNFSNGQITMNKCNGTSFEGVSSDDTFLDVASSDPFDITQSQFKQISFDQGGNVTILRSSFGGLDAIDCFDIWIEENTPTHESRGGGVLSLGNCIIIGIVNNTMDGSDTVLGIGSSRSIYIAGNVVNNSRYGFHIEDSKDIVVMDHIEPVHISMEDCTNSYLIDNSFLSVELLRSKFINLTTNHIESLELESSPENNITGNTIENPDGNGVVLLSSAAIIMEKNIIKNCSKDGIQLTESNYCALGENEILGNENGLVLTDSAITLIDNNTFGNNTEYGIMLDDKGTVVSGNTFLGNGGGISMKDDVHMVDIHKNTFSGNEVGIMFGVGCNDISAENNSFDNHSHHAIALAQGSFNNTVKNNTIRDGEKYGVWAYISSDNRIFANTITNNTEGGIYLSTLGSNEVEENEIERNGIGISIHDSDGNNITRNTIQLNDIGIKLVTSDLINITGNFIVENDIGFDLTYGNCLVWNNRFNNDQNVQELDFFGGHTWNVSKQAGKNIMGGAFIGGNFWNNYHGEDWFNDGLGDTLTPHTDGGNITIGGDYLPLVFHASNVINEDTGEGFDGIQAAIDDPDTKDGHTIQVVKDPKVENIVIYKELTIYASGGSRREIDAVNPNMPAILIQANNVKLKGFEVSQSNQEGGCGIKIGPMIGNEVEKCNLENLLIKGNDNGIIANNLTNSLFNGIEVVNSNKIGISMENCSITTIRESKITRNGDDGIYILSCFAMQIHECEIAKNGALGLNLIDSGNTHLAYVNVTDHEGERGGGIMIQLCSFVGMDMINLHNNNQFGMHLLYVTESIYLRRINASENHGNGIRIDGGCKNNRFEELTLNGNEWSGMEINEGVEGLTIHNYECNSNKDSGILIENAKGIHLDQGKINENEDEGIWIKDALTKYSIENTTIQKNGKNGVRIEGPVDEFVQDGDLHFCEIHENGGDGVLVKGGKDIRLLNCHITGNDGNGVYFGNVQDSYVRKCSIKFNSKNGVDCFDAEDIVFDSSGGPYEAEIMENDEHGIRLLDSEECYVFGYNLSLNEYDGFKAKATNFIFIALSQFSDNHVSGIDLVGCRDIKINGNQVWGNEENGISLSGCSDALIEFNEVNRNVIDGLSLLLTDTTVMRKNKIEENSKVGIHLDQSNRNEISDNTFRGNCQAVHISISGETIIRNNVFLESTCLSSSLHLDGSSPTVIGNTFSQDAGDAIVCENGSVPMIQYNNFDSNAGYDISNLDPAVTIDARYNYWGSPEGPGAGSVSGSVDTADFLLGIVLEANVTELKDTGIIEILDDHMIIEFKVTGPTLLTVIRLEKSPTQELEDLVGDYYLIMIDEPANVTELEIQVVFWDMTAWVDNDESYGEFMWWTGEEWSPCSESIHELNRTGDFSIRAVWFKVNDTTTPDTGELGHLLLGVTMIDPNGKGEEDDDGSTLIWLLPVVVIILVAMVLFIKRDVMFKEQNKEESGESGINSEGSDGSSKDEKSKESEKVEETE